MDNVRCRFKVLLPLLCLIFLFGGAASVFADTTGYKVFSPEYNVSPDKAWTIKFNMAVAPESLNQISVVKKVNGQVVENPTPELKADGISVILPPPAGGYEPETEYTLIVGQVESLSGHRLAQPARKEFTTAASTGEPVTGTVDEEVVKAALTAVETALNPLFATGGTLTPETLEQTLGNISGINLLMAEEEGALAEIGEDGPLMFIFSGQPTGGYDSNLEGELEPEAYLPQYSGDLDVFPLTADNSLISYPSAMNLASLGDQPHVSVPKGLNVLLLSGLEGALYKDITPDIKKLFTHSSRSDYSVTCKPATIENLKGVRNVDVLFIKSHGQKASFVWPDTKVYGIPTYCLASSTLVNLKDPCPAYLNEDLIRRNVVFMLEPTVRADRMDWLYGITFGFVDRYWSFNPGGFAFICACSSASPEAMTFRGSILQKGVSVYAGFTEKVETNFADDRAKYVFDRLLGVNYFKKPTPNQRPFTYREINEELIDKGAATWSGDAQYVPSTLKFVEGTTNDSFGLLNPSIRTLSINELTDSNLKPILTINGIFGNKMGRVFLLTDDSTEELEIIEWGPKRITCTIDPDDAGDIMVEVDGRQSNYRRITKWKGTVTYTAIPNPPGDGMICTLKDKITWDLVFRADVASFRERPGYKPWDREVEFEPTKKSETEYSSSGKWLGPTDDGGMVRIVEWEGGGKVGVNKFTLIGGDKDDFDCSRCYLKINTDLSKQPYAEMNIRFQGKWGSKNMICDTGLSGSITVEGRADSLHRECYHDHNFASSAYYLHLPFDSNWNIQAGSKSAQLIYLDMASSVKLKMEWTAMAAEYPPIDDRNHGI